MGFHGLRTVRAINDVLSCSVRKRHVIFLKVIASTTTTFKFGDAFDVHGLLFSSVIAIYCLTLWRFPFSLFNIALQLCLDVTGIDRNIKKSYLKLDI